jgi:hypothetical protein
MKERILTVCSLMAGAAVVTLATAIQSDSFTNTHAEARKDSVPAATGTSVSAGEATMTREVDAQRTPRVIHLPPIVISGSLQRERPERPDAAELEPCSKSRDSGPSTVVDGLPHSGSRVRLLCSSNGQPGEHLATNSSQAPG